MANAKNEHPQFACTIPIPDSCLDQLIVIGAELEAERPMDAASIELVRITFRPLLVELRKRRGAMSSMGLNGPEDHLCILELGAA